MYKHPATGIIFNSKDDADFHDLEVEKIMIERSERLRENGYPPYFPPSWVMNQENEEKTLGWIEFQKCLNRGDYDYYYFPEKFKAKIKKEG